MWLLKWCSLQRESANFFKENTHHWDIECESWSMGTSLLWKWLACSHHCSWKQASFVAKLLMSSIHFTQTHLAAKFCNWKYAWYTLCFIYLTRAMSNFSVLCTKIRQIGFMNFKLSVDAWVYKSRVKFQFYESILELMKRFSHFLLPSLAQSGIDLMMPFGTRGPPAGNSK